MLLITHPYSSLAQYQAARALQDVRSVAMDYFTFASYYTSLLHTKPSFLTLPRTDPTRSHTDPRNTHRTLTRSTSSHRTLTHSTSLPRSRGSLGSAGSSSSNSLPRVSSCSTKRCKKLARSSTWCSVLLSESCYNSTESLDSLSSSRTDTGSSRGSSTGSNSGSTGSPSTGSTGTGSTGSGSSALSSPKQADGHYDPLLQYNKYGHLQRQYELSNGFDRQRDIVRGSHTYKESDSSSDELNKREVYKDSSSEDINKREGYKESSRRKDSNMREGLSSLEECYSSASFTLDPEQYIKYCLSLLDTYSLYQFTVSTSSF